MMTTMTIADHGRAGSTRGLGDDATFVRSLLTKLGVVAEPASFAP